MKLFVLLTYNNRSNKVLLCLLCLIYNENEETFMEIFKFLKINFNLKHSLFTVDFGKAGCLALNSIFPETSIFPCYFHFIRRMIIHIKNLHSKNKVIKRNAKNLLFNMK